MNTIQRISKNISVLFLSQILSYIFAFFTLMYSARYFGVEQFGILSFALAFTGIFSILMDLGLSTLTIRELARNKSLFKKYIGNIIPIKIFLSLTSSCLMIIIVNLMGYDQQTINVTYFIIFYTILNTFSLLFYSVFQANEKMEFPALGYILNSSLLFLGILMAIYYGFNIYQFSFVYIIVSAFILVYAIIVFSWKFKLPKMEFNWKIWKSIINESLPFTISGISINIYLWIDTIILSFIQGQEAVGLYNAAYRLITILFFIPIVFNTVLFPVMSQYFVSSKESLIFTFDKLFKTMIIIGVPIGVGIVFIANKIIMLIYGNQFLDAVIILQILIWSTVLIFAQNPLLRLLESSNKQLSVSKIYLIGVLFNSTLNIVFIPIFSYVAAAIITVLTDILIFGLAAYAVKSMNIKISKNTRISVLKILLASIIMGLVINQLINLNIFVLIIIGIIAYVISLIILQIFDDEEVQMIKALFQKGN